MSSIKECSNRFELLGDRLKTRFFDFVWLSFLVFLFLLPLLGWIITCNYVFVPKVTTENFFLYSLIIYVPYIPLGMIFGLGITGALYYCKRLAWQEGSNVTTDVFYGIGKNIKFSLITFSLLFLAYALVKIGTVLLAYSLPNVSSAILTAIMYVAFFVVLLILFFTLVQSLIYVGSFAQLASNSVKFTFGMFGWNLLILLVVLLPFLCYEFIPFQIAQYIAIGVSLLFYFAFSLFVFTIYSHSIFDLTLNQEYPEIYRKGLTKEEK